MAFSGALTQEGSSTLNYANKVKTFGSNINPTSGDFMLVCVGHQNTSNEVSGITAGYAADDFARIARVASATASRGAIELWYARSDGSGASQITLTRTGGSYYTNMEAIRIAGGLKTDGTQASVIAQSEVDQEFNPANPWQVCQPDLAAFSTDSLLFVLTMAHWDRNLTTPVPVSPLAAVSGYGDHNHYAYYSNTEDTTPEHDWTSDPTDTEHFGIAVEFLASGGGGGGATPYYNNLLHAQIGN